MKEFEKWWHNPRNEKINKLYEEDAPRQDWTEAGYRRAFELMLEWLEIEEPFEDFYRRIEEELKE